MRKEENRKRIGQRIVELRKAKGMTQQDLADMTGNQRNHISRISPEDGQTLRLMASSAEELRSQIASLDWNGLDA